MAQALSEKLEHIGPAEKERLALVPQRESGRQARQSRPCQKEKERSRQSKAPDRKRERVKVSESRAWRERGKSERGYKKERVSSTVKEEGF